MNTGLTSEGAGTRSGPAFAPDNTGKDGGTDRRRRMEQAKAMAHNVKAYDVGRQAHVGFSPGA
jgi:hypothetical protein